MDAESGPAPVRVLFVCLGNICRSPMAEGVFLHLVEEAGVSAKFEVDSAGTGSWHVGEPADPRAAMAAREHGIALPSRARQVTADDLARFDHVIAMDRDNLRTLEHMAPNAGARAEIRLLREFDPVPEGGDVPDPYYGGSTGFESVYQIVKRSCEALLASLTAAR